jgi:hypothetical protein
MDYLIELSSKWNIDLIIVAIVLLSGFFQERYLFMFYISKDSKHDQAIKTLLVSLVASIVYILLLYKGAEIAWAKYFISYFAATSLYELLVKPFTKWIEKINEKTEIK